MAFAGDFEKLDDEIKVQLKAIKNNDFKTIEKIHRQELTAEDQKIYLMSKDERKAIVQDYEDKYDSDLEQAMYQEFWTELRELKTDKEKDQKRKAQSVVRGAVQSQPALGFQQRGGFPMYNNYQTSSRGIGGKFGDVFEHYNPSFSIDPRDPYSPINKEIGEAYIKPRMKFDTIFDEYVEKRKKFDTVKAGQAAAESAAASGDTKKSETEALKNKIVVIQKNFEIEMKHAKEVAAKNALELVQQKLAESKFAYEEELEHIAKQFEAMQREVR